MTYELYKPLRNHLRQYSLLESLGVVRAYVQHLQFDQAFPSDIEVDATFLRASDVEKRVYGVHEWELELLAKELILNAPDIGKKDLRSWKEFSTSINKIKSLLRIISALIPPTGPCFKRMYYSNCIASRTGSFPGSRSQTQAPSFDILRFSAIQK
jgi:hypothetical protein